MARRVVAGILGGVAGILPLVLVNLLVNAGGALGDVEALAVEYALALGIVALLGGVVVGGGLAGWLGARAGDGVVGASLAGGLAAALYAVTVILVLVGGARQGWGPSVAAIHPIRVSAAIIMVACLLLGMALITGALVGRERRRAGERTAARRGANGGARVGNEPGYGPGYGPGQGQGYARNTSGYGPNQARERGQGYGQGYDRSDGRGASPARSAHRAAARAYSESRSGDPRSGERYPATPARPRTSGSSPHGPVHAPTERSRGRGDR